ncbi:Alcohol dehydrogenase [Rasamsonia emersonii CBS 393.64]|uniref:Alcohol dehydrogenase n=1 Tax=Rasamsonia emersonii (strain ATCC 16479 / CBS 393.64 / IMI 116815) TaxID=1408163 RepID=A0A0F4YVB3_RASE3|nr:Alcohol dehydrogenase [Rasamsonia emersonii CBS 393.64]KKA22159.1 Alcohol dehydrogenase [Rasamsonia emersonii CBS 393.64]
MKALVYQGPGKATVVSDRPVPKVRDHYILVKVKAIALNPTDWKHVYRGLPKEGSLIGVDYAGIVEEVGPNVTKDFKKGDRVAGFVHGGNYNNPEDGAFAEYIVAKEHMSIKIPDHLSFEEAATLGCGISTVGQGLYEKDYGLGLALPSQPLQQPETILIYGGSSATGTLGIQFAKASGYTVITTCSPKNFDLVKRLGATEAFDYHDPECGKKINEYTQNKLKYVWDCISTDDSVKICAEALTSGPGAHYGTILSPEFPRKDVKYTVTLAYTGIGEDFDKFGAKFANNQAHAEFQAKWWAEEAQPLLANGTIKVHPVSLRKNGLAGAIEGMQEMKEEKHSGVKLWNAYGLAARDPIPSLGRHIAS